MLIYSKVITVLIALVVLLLASLFSLLETAIVAISEHKLKSLSTNKLWARYALKLKEKLEQVLIFSLFGNSLFNAIFTTITTVLVIEIVGTSVSKSLMLPIATLFVAIFIIIFSEATPKIIAAKAPTLILTVISAPLYYLFSLLRPVIWLIDKLVYLFTNLFRMSDDGASLEELKSIIADEKSPLKEKHKSILLNSMELGSLTVRDILIPLRMVESINLKADIISIHKQVYTTHHTRLAVYEDTLDNIIGFIHAKDLLSLDKLNLTHEAIRQIVRPIEVVSDFMPLIKQINRATRRKTRIFIVVNEYGDVAGIACLEDMLETVFGNFTTDSPSQKTLAILTEENNIIVDGTMLIRELNEMCSLNIKIMPDAMTINGLVLKTLHSIPKVGVCFKLGDLIFEIINMGTYWVERVKITILDAP